MAVSFPTSLDNFTEPSTPSSTPLSSAGDGSRDHITHHIDLGNAIEALEAKVGADGSAVTASLDYKASKAVSRIAQTVLGSAAASISFASIPSTYESLMLVLSGRADTASFPSDYIQARFNNDSAANYYDTYVLGQGTTLSGLVDAGIASVGTGKFPAATAAANRGGQLVAIVGGYARTTFHKPIMTWCAYSTDTTTATQQVILSAGLWASTAAINRWDVFPSGGNFLAGTVATLYGLV